MHQRPVGLRSRVRGGRAGPSCPAVATVVGGAVVGGAPLSVDRRTLRRQQHQQQRQLQLRLRHARQPDQRRGLVRGDEGEVLDDQRQLWPELAAPPILPTPGSRRMLLGRRAHINSLAASSPPLELPLPEAPPPAPGTVHPGSDGATDARRLTKRLVTSVCWRELQRVLQSAPAGAVNIIHISAALSRIAKLHAASPQSEEDNLNSDHHHKQQQLGAGGQWVVQQRHASDPGLSILLEELDNRAAMLLGCAAEADARPGPAHVPRMLPQPQQLATIAWSWGALRHCPSHACMSAFWVVSSAKLGRYTSGELAMTLWGIGRLHQRPPPGWMAAFELASRHRLWAFKPHELTMVLWGLSELGLPPGDEWWDQALAVAAAKAPEFEPRDAAQVLWAVAALCRAPPPGWTDSLLTAVEARLPLFSARDVSVSIWALGRFGAAEQQRKQQQQQQQMEGEGDAGIYARWVHRLLSVLARSNVKLAAATLRDHANILWALAALRLPPSDAWARVAWDATGAALEAAVLGQRRRVASLPAQQTRQQRPEEQHQQQQQQSTQLTAASLGPTWHPEERVDAQVTAFPPLVDERDASHLAWAAAVLYRMGSPPGPAWLALLWAATGPDLPGYGAQAAAMLLWGSARSGVAPPLPWVTRTLRAVELDLASLQPQGACQMLGALATLRRAPRPGFMRRMLARMQLELHLLPPSGYACVLCSLGVLRYRPGETWWASFWYCMERTVPACSARDLEGILRGAVALDWPPPAATLRALGERAAEVLPSAAPRLHGKVLLSLARLGWKPDDGGSNAANSVHLLATTEAAMQRDDCAAADVARLLNAVQRLGATPGRGWLAAVQAALARVGCDTLSPVVAARTLVALSTLGAVVEPGCIHGLVDAIVALPTAGAVSEDNEQHQKREQQQQVRGGHVGSDLLDAVACALSSWPNVPLDESRLQRLLTARVAVREHGGRQRSNDAPPPPAALAAWEALAGRAGTM